MALAVKAIDNGCGRQRALGVDSPDFKPPGLSKTSVLTKNYLGC